MHLKHWSSIYPDELEQLATLQADILITHEAPGYHEHGFKELDALARRMGVRMTVHGHQHDCIDSSAHWEAQGFQSFGVGLRGVMAVDGFDNFLGSVERSSHGHTPTHERDPFEGMPGSIELFAVKLDN